MEITHKRLLELFTYDARTGIFRRKIRMGKWHAGTVAGAHSHGGYKKIWIEGRRYYLHRLAWFYIHKRWPRNELDHINGDPSDNRIKNLRRALHKENMRNLKLRQDNTSGYRGVAFHPQTGKWRASVTSCGRRYSFGLHETPELAAKSYRKGATVIFKEFFRRGMV